MTILAHKIALDPNQEQASYFRQACGTARFAFNWALDEWKCQYAIGEKSSAAKLKIQWNAVRRERFPWSLEVTKCAGSQGIMNLGRASENWKKAKVKLARLHSRIANIRRDTLHKLTTRLAKGFEAIGIEDLNVRGMVKNHCLARAVSDQGFFEFRRQLAYKCKMTGAVLNIHDRWYPSSKTCSNCGHVLDVLPLSLREWVCPECGVVHDRDVNAAKNLKPTTAGLAESNACGLEGSGLDRKIKTKPAKMKQELCSAHLCVEER